MKRMSEILYVLPLVLLATSAVVGLISVALYMDVPVDPLLVATAWFLTFGIYGINRFTDVEDMVNEPEQRLFFQRNKFLLWVSWMSITASVATLFCAGRLTWIHLCIVLVGMIYSLRMIPIFTKGQVRYLRLKDIILSKSLFVALVWTVGFFAINWVLFPHLIHDRLTIILLAFGFSLVVFANVNFMDIFDMIGDRATGVPTVPARYGIRNTILYTIAVPCSVWILVVGGLAAPGYISKPVMLFLVVMALFPALYVGLYLTRNLSKKTLALVVEMDVFVFSTGLLVLKYWG